LRSLPPAWLAFGAVLVVFGLGIPALVIDDHKSETSGGGGGEGAASGGEATTTTTTTGGGGGTKKAAGGGGGNAALIALGKQDFQQNCGTCHTLADAGTNGKVGPVLDQV